MADNVTLNPGSAGAVIRAKNIGGVDTQLVGLDIGGETAELQVSAANPMPTGWSQSPFTFSVVNSSVAQLTPGHQFVGTIEANLNQDVISIICSSDQPGTLQVYQSIDAGGINQAPVITIQNGGTNLTGINSCIPANGNYVWVSYTNNGIAATTTFNLNVAYGNGLAITNSLGNTPISISDVGGVKVGSGSVPVNVTSSIPVSDPSTTAAQSSDNPLFFAQTGDPAGDFAGIDMFSAMFDSSNGLSQNVNVINQPKTDSLSNGGVLPADGQGPWILQAGQSIVIDTLGYQAVICQSISGSVTVSTSNYLASNTFQSSVNVMGLGATAGLVSGNIQAGYIGLIPVSGRYLKLIQQSITGSNSVTYLRSEIPSTISSANGSPINIANVSANISTAGTSGTLPIGGSVPEGSSSTTYPVLTGNYIRTAALAAISAGDVVMDTGTSGGAKVTWPYAVPDVSWQYYIASATSGSVAMKVAGATGIRNYCAAITICASAALTASTTYTINILDGATVIWSYAFTTPVTLGQFMPETINFPIPLRGSTATAMNVQASAASVFSISSQGFQAP